MARSKRGKNRARDQGQSPAPDDARSVAIAEPPAPDEGGDSGLGALAAASEPVADAALGGSDASEPDLDDSKLDLARLVAVAKRESARPDAERTAESSAIADALASGGFASITSVASVAAPVARPRPTWVLPLLLGLGLGVGLAGLMFGLNARGGEPKPAAPVPAVAASAGAMDPAPAAVPAPAAAVPPAAAEAAEGEVAAAAPTPVAAPAPATPSPEPGPTAPGPAAKAGPAARAAATASSAGRPGTAPRTPAAKAAPGVVTAAAAPAPAAPAPAAAQAPKDAASQAAAAKTAPRSVDELLDQALAPEAQRNVMQEKQAAALAQAQLPATPSRDDVTKAMTVLLPAIRGCAMGHSGLANAVIVVRNDGQVASVEIGNAPFAGTASGRCMEGVMRRAQFPRFSQPIFRVKFPFAIQ